jgi:hypothetical protein
MEFESLLKDAMTKIPRPMMAVHLLAQFKLGITVSIPTQLRVLVDNASISARFVAALPPARLAAQTMPITAH